MSTIHELVRHHAFAPISALDRTEEEVANTRTFLGDGTPYLRVPGLLELYGVRTSDMIFPMTETREFPLDASLRRLETVTMPMFDLAHLQDGTPVLRRNACSNDGIFQDMERFMISGLWDDSVPAPVIPEDEKKPRKKGLR